ncbi:MAG TPA: COR domain-containing protein [Cytophagaceae bacterium]|nr:COR domain-containing protein [Cytophagaceae bacterium]
MSEKSIASILANTGTFISNPEVLKDPPFEIVNQGDEVVRRYFQENEKQGIQRLVEAKIVIVGAGESGKTTLIRKLQNPNHPVPNAEDKRTEGIRVTTYPFLSREKKIKKTIHAHIWDFGGQEIYHTTHQLFLTADTLYILLNDNRKNDTDFYYWLNIVTLRAGEKSPILMIFNAKDNATRQIIPGEEIFATFPNLIQDSIDVNFADKDLRGIRKMKTIIEGHFSCLEVLEKPFPAYWVKVRDSLIALPQEHINWNTFKEICEQNGVNDLAQMKVLVRTLNNLGVLLYFPEIFGLDDLIILKLQWCIDAIYSALDTKDIIDNNGRFNELILEKKWAGERYAGNHLQLLKIMQHFDLCYKIEGTNEYIAPQLLPIKENKIFDASKAWDIVFMFEYTFMPAGLVTRLIARMSLFIKEPHAWRSGVVLQWDDGTVAEVVEHQLTHKIVIKINGAGRRRRLLDLRKCLFELQNDFKGLRFKELVNCNCADCLESAEPTVFELKTLEDDAEHDDSVTCRNGSRKKILAKNILDGIKYEDTTRLFVSYSHRNEKFKNEFRAMIRPMEKEGHWKVWDDRWLLPSDEWNQEIIRHLNDANVIVLLITKEFFDSNFIYDIEFARAIKRHETGDALVIGILISECLWEETPLSRIQILPKDAKPLDQQKNRNAVWKTVAVKIKETIQVKLRNNSRSTGWVI